jgi:FAD/FMN-containing dehydrogenase
MPDLTALAQALRAVVGDENVLAGTAVSERTAHVWDPLPLQAGLLVRPASVESLAKAVKLCHTHKQPVVTHGGLTGLVKGTESGPGDVVISLERLNAIEAIDPIGRTITVQAGAVLEKVQAAVAEHQLQLGLDLGARGSCTIGGNIATNAGGLSVVRHGMMRDQVLGLEAVLADGTTLSSMNTLIKNNTGFDLKQLFIGTEGTLGVITRAVLKLRPATPHAKTVLAACERFDQVIELLGHLDSALDGSLSAYEVLWNNFYQLNCDPQYKGHVDAPLPRDFPLYVIAEASGTSLEILEQRFDGAAEQAHEMGLISDAILPQSEAERRRIWQIRENVDTQRQHTPVFTFDVSLPIPAMPDYLTEIEAQLKRRWPELTLYVYGHLADGNLHIVAGPLPMGTEPPASLDVSDWHRECSDIVYAPLQAIGGSISAEHGIGLSKKPWLHITRSPEERDLMRRLKATLDPQQLLNPGLIL